MEDYVAGRLPAGCFTDDTEMMLALADSLIDCGRFDGEDVGSRFVDWASAGPADVGLHTRVVLERLRQGESWRSAARAVQAANPDSAGNGSVMRCFPIALLYSRDLDTCLKMSREQSLVTHAHQDCLAACAWVNAVIWHAFQGAGVGDAVALACHVVELPPQLSAVVEGAADADERKLRNSGWVVDTLQSAVWGLLTTDDYEGCVTGVANLGNDADTAAAVAGAMAGAIYGLSGIPSRWIEPLRGQWPIRSGQWLSAKDLIRRADSLMGMSDTNQGEQ